MIMKRYIVSMACVIAALVSCQKNETPVEAADENQPIRLTLTATIGGDDTKVTYVDEENVLKAAWEAGDKVSLLSLDISGNLLSNDVFEATSAGKSAEFEGSFTNDPATVSVWVYYPALTEGSGDGVQDSEAWHSPKTYTSDVLGVLYGARQGTPYISRAGATILQKEQSSSSHVGDYTMLYGVADIDKLLSEDFSVVLSNMSYVIKAEFTLPEEDMTIYNIQISCKNEDGTQSVRVSGTGWFYINSPEISAGNGSSTFHQICLGDDVDGGTGTGLELEGNKITVYFVGYSAKTYYVDKQARDYPNVVAGDYFDISASVGKNSEWYDCVAKCSFTKDLTFENGKMYRMSATLVKED